MANQRINLFLWIGIIGTLTIGTGFFTDLYQVSRGNHSIWWTPQAMRLPVAETGDQFEFYIGGEPLGKHLADGTLFAVDKNGKQYTLVSKDISVRLNNWDKIKASILWRTTLSGFVFGVAAAFLIFGLVQFFNRQKKII